jgi:hypothetical protein
MPCFVTMSLSYQLATVCACVVLSTGLHPALLCVKIRRSTQEPHTQWQARASPAASQSGPSRSI